MNNGIVRTATLSILITLAFAANSVLAQDKVGTRAIAGDKDNATPPTSPATKAVSITPSSAAVTITVPEVMVVGYFSTKITTKAAQKRHAQAGLDMDAIKTPVGEGGLGVLSGFIDVETDLGWKCFVKMCGGEAGAQAYRTLLRRGGIAVGLTDPEGKSWDYGPIYLNEMMDGVPQISQLTSEHRRRFPNRYASAAIAGSTKPTAAVPSTTTPLVKAASPTTATNRPVPIGSWALSVYTLELPGLDEEGLSPRREERLRAVTRAVNNSFAESSRPEGSRMELTDVEGRRTFNKYVRDNPKIRLEDYRRYLAELYNGAVIVQRDIRCEDGEWRAVDEEPVFLTGGIEEWTKVQRLLQSPINLAAQTPKPTTAIVVPTSGTTPSKTAVPSTGKGTTK